MAKKTTLDHHLMISMIAEYNSFRDYASRSQTQQNEDIAAFCAVRACCYCADAGYDPQSLITDAFNVAKKFGFDENKARA